MSARAVSPAAVRGKPAVPGSGLADCAWLGAVLDAGNVKRRLADPVAVAQALGLAEGARRQRGGLTILCPWHAERTPSCSLSTGQDGTLRAHCFGCGQSGDVFSLVAAVQGLNTRTDFVRVVRETAALFGLDGSAALSPSPRPPQPPRQPPPLTEVVSFWERCSPVYEAPELCLRLFDRALDPAVIADRDLARMLPPAGPLPRWAGRAGQSWRDSCHTLIVPLYDAAGVLQSVHARSLHPDADPKGLSPAGHSSAGLVMGCPFARLLLAQGVPAWWRRSEPPVVIVCEGVPDFLTDASHYGDWEQAPATLGIISGAWSEALAARIPDGCRVIVRTHSDEAGQRYRHAVAESLCARCPVEVIRHG